MSDLIELYKKYYTSAKRELRKNGCTDTIFDDLYQESFSILMERENTSGTTIRYPYTYIIRMSKNLWLKELKRRQNHEIVENMDKYQYPESDKKPELKLLLIYHMKRLPESCREVLKLYLQGYSEDKICRDLNLRDSVAARNKKYYCKEKLRNMIQNDPLYEELNG